MIQFGVLMHVPTATGQKPGGYWCNGFTENLCSVDVMICLINEAVQMIDFTSQTYQKRNQ